MRLHLTVTSGVADGAVTGLKAQLSIKDNKADLSQRSPGGSFWVWTIKDTQALQVSKHGYI